MIIVRNRTVLHLTVGKQKLYLYLTELFEQQQEDFP